MLLVLLFFFAPLVIGSCPKETFWRLGKCFGSTDGDALGELSSSCCECPPMKNLRFDGLMRCSYTTAWLKRTIAVARSCCEGVHYQAESKRGPLKPMEVDQAKLAFNEVSGRGYMDAAPAPFEGESSPFSIGRRLLSVSANILCARTAVNVRERPQVSARIVGRTSRGAQVTVRGRSSDNGWLQLESGGWSSAAYYSACSPSSSSSSSSSSPSSSSTSRVSSTPRQLPTSSSSFPNGLCPDFYKIWNAYPNIHQVPSDELLSSIGFGSWVANTCAIRTSLAMKSVGIEPGEIGRAKWIAKSKRYLIRVAELAPFFTALYGSPYVTGGPGVRIEGLDSEGNEAYDHPANFKGKAGIIWYSNCNFKDATGHFDVWDGSTIRSHGYPDKCKKMSLFNVCNPRANPDYSAFKQYLKRTKAA